MKKNLSLGKNIFLLFSVKMSGFLLPLVTLPYLARVLGAEEFGRVAVAQSMALVLSVLIEYGFSLSATRDAARYRHEPEKMASLVCRVHGAKIFLSVVALLAATASLKFVGGISGVAFATGAWIYALVIGISPIWYYQGIERVKLFSMLDITGKAISVILIILLVQAEDASWVLFLQAAGPAATAAVSIFWLYRSVEFKIPRFSHVLSGLREGASMFVFRAAISLYTLANVFVLGIFVGPIQVAYFAGAEKLARGAASMIGPVSQAVYPRVARLVFEDRPAAIRLVQKTMAGMFLGAIAVSILVYVFSSEITMLVFGPAYGPVAEMMRGMIWIVPLIATGNVLGIQWMLALKMDKEFNFAVIAAGLVNLMVAALLSREWGAKGMVVACVLSEAMVVILILRALLRKKALPLIMKTSS
ncbi:oligosaccharide flippase family protein [Variovorax paradoxus]|uniref:oligosaccharide flippase family protein n=1 Tax=Variovorax paradoxus TaxID=34073 RepID=UPI003ECFF5D2